MKDGKLDAYARCVVCHKIIFSVAPWTEPWCKPCANKYPASLLKAAVDPFEYVLKLRSGEVINFESAQFAGKFVHLHSASDCGVDVCISDIVWCRDEGR
jgi:hypothetical protein